MKRRRFLVTVGTASASLSGCLGPDMPKDAIVRAVQEPPPEDVEVVEYDALPQAEQQIARTAVEADIYHACPELPEAVRSFAARFEEPDNAYLNHQGTSYAVWIRIQDIIRVRTAAAPENPPSCSVI